MLVKDVMTTDVKCCNADTDLTTAAGIMCGIATAALSRYEARRAESWSAYSLIATLPSPRPRGAWDRKISAPLMSSQDTSTPAVPTTTSARR
jgi:hypothetical protein